ncbi:MAG: MarR family winged helix-turn-helix transcriptional regulator [Acidimicrobiales bacterium]
MAPVRWLSEPEERAWRGYRRMRTLLDLQIARDLARDSGLSDSDYDVLSTLTEAAEPPWRASALAERLLWSTSRLAHHVGRMERRGLVLRGECRDDARGATVTLTESGCKALREAAPLHVGSVRAHLIDLLTPKEIETLATIAAKVLEHLAASPTEPEHRPERRTGPPPGHLHLARPKETGCS